MKMYLKNIILSFLLIGMPLKGISQDKEVTQILQEVTNHYNNTDVILLQMKYELKRGVVGNEVTESYKGAYVKKGVFSKLSLLNSEVIHFEGVKIVVDHNSKAMEYSNANDLKQNNPIDISSFVKYYENATVTGSKDEFICELRSESLSNILPYNKVVLYIDKKEYTLNRQELFFSRKLPFTNEKGKKEEDFGRLVISLSKNETLNENIDDKLNNYIVKNGDTFFPSQKYKGYQIINSIGKI